MKKLRVGLIGCGDRQWAHIKALLDMEDVEIVAVADLIEERRQKAAQATGAARIYKDHSELYDNENADTLDAVFISIEPSAHTDTETRAIEKGIPFLVEKPMTVDLELARKIVTMVKEKNLITSVGLQDRYMDLTEKMKEEISKHKPGGIVYGRWACAVPGIWWWQKKENCGGQLTEQGLHLMDSLRYLFGEAKSIYAINGRGIIEPGIDAPQEYDTDDYSVCIIKFDNNVTATLTCSCFHTKVIRPDCGMRITMQDVMMDYNFRKTLTLKYRDKVIDFKRENDQTAVLDRTFLNAVKTGDASKIRTPYSDAIKSLELCLEANRSMETGQAVHF